MSEVLQKSFPGRSHSYDRDFKRRFFVSPTLRSTVTDWLGVLIAAPMLANTVRSSSSVKIPLASHTANHSFMALGKPMCGGETDWRRLTPTTSDRCLNKSQACASEELGGFRTDLRTDLSALVHLPPQKRFCRLLFDGSLTNRGG